MDTRHTLEEKRRAWRNLILIVIGCALAMWLLPGCTTTKYVPVTQTHTEHHWHTDSVHQIDSVINEKNTIIREVDSAAMAQYGIQLKNAERAWLIETQSLRREIERLESMSTTSDTLHDTIPQPYPVEVQVEKQLSWWQRTQMYAGDALFLLIIGMVIYGYFKFTT